MSDLLKVAAIVVGVMIVPLCFIFPNKVAVLAAVGGGFVLLCIVMWFLLKNYGK
jgi:hypothetical protein